MVVPVWRQTTTVFGWVHQNAAPGVKSAIYDCLVVYWRQAKDILIEHNINDDLNSPMELGYMMRRFVKFNGGISADQLTWLDSILQKSDENNEVVLVAGCLLVDIVVYL